MSSHELFLRKKDLADKLASVVKSDWFTECLTYARSAMMEQGNVTKEERDGAKKFEMILTSLPDPETESAEFPSAGLNHDLTPIKPADKKRKK